ncbi:MAG: hypothetical protein IT437_11835 [Phycisphaerales bacterium]|nr:hypothetical protein [Phycisphaerales bacterium]
MLTRTWVAALLGLVLAAGLGGCSGGPGAMGRYDIEVSMDPELAQQTGGAPQVRVDLVGVNDMDFSRWSGESMSGYWSSGSALRSESRESRHEITFGPGNTGTKTLSKKDKIWDKWKAGRVMHLFVLASLPGVGMADRPGAEDGRRLILPLDSKRWPGTSVIKVLVQKSRVTCTTPPAPPKVK